MPDVARQLERHLRPAQLDLMRQASKVSAEQGVELFLVGGTMRDILSRQQPADLDLVALGDIGDLASALVDELGGEVLAHSQFGTFKAEAARNCHRSCRRSARELCASGGFAHGRPGLHGR